MKTATTLICTIAAAGLHANADVVATGQFVGDYSENFENIAPLGMTPGPASTFADHCVTGDIFAGGVMIANNLTSFLTETSILPFNGNLMGGSVTGKMSFDFDAPMHAFGGMIGTADILTESYAVFIDDDGFTIDTVDFTLGGPGEWNWFGWTSDAAFTRVEIHAAPNPGLPIVFDDMQVSAVPAPTTASIIALTGLAATCRRRA